MSNVSHVVPPNGAELLVRAEAELAAGAFWEAHETLEPLWLSLGRGPAADRLRGVIQLAAALHKSRQACPRPGLALERGLQRLADRAEAGWGRGCEALPAPEPLERAFAAALAEARRWGAEAAAARRAGRPFPPPVEGVALPLGSWRALSLRGDVSSASG